MNRLTLAVMRRLREGPHSLNRTIHLKVRHCRYSLCGCRPLSPVHVDFEDSSFGGNELYDMLCLKWKKKKKEQSETQRQSSNELQPESTKTSCVDRRETNKDPWDAEQIEVNTGQGHQSED